MHAAMKAKSPLTFDAVVAVRVNVGEEVVPFGA